MTSSSSSSSRASLTQELRSLSALLIQATQDTTQVVEDMHHTIAGGPALLGKPFAPLIGPPTRLIYRNIRGVTGLVGRGVELALTQLEPALDALGPGPELEPLRAVLSGVVGDHLEAIHSPLAIQPQLRRQGQALTLEPQALRDALPQAQPWIILDVHGSSMSDLMMARQGHHHGLRLAALAQATSVSALYNSGLHISTNGHHLSALIQALVDAWPCPVERLTLLGFSMGGLVARSAVLSAQRQGLSWPHRLSAIATLGSPHQGAPLERAGNLVETLLGVSRYSAPLRTLARLRSAGVTDLRHGSVLDEHWRGQDRFARAPDPRRGPECALPSGVPCFAVAATRSLLTPDEAAQRVALGQLADLKDDGIVPVMSALGRHANPARDLGLAPERCHLEPECTHLGLLARASVAQRLERWLIG